MTSSDVHPHPDSSWSQKLITQSLALCEMSQFVRNTLSYQAMILSWIHLKALKWINFDGRSGSPSYCFHWKASGPLVYRSTWSSSQRTRNTRFRMLSRKVSQSHHFMVWSLFLTIVAWLEVCEGGKFGESWVGAQNLWLFCGISLNHFEFLYLYIVLSCRRIFDLQMATGGRSLDSPRWCLYELASYLKDETVRDQRNIQILPVHLCFWAFHKACWKSLSF